MGRGRETRPVGEGTDVSKYMTKQRRALLGYLAEHTDEQLSVQTISEALEGEGVSLSALYRNLAELESEGKVKRELGAGREAFYRYTDSDRCAGCLHLQCKRCGRTFHMDNDSAARLIENVAKADGFEIDKSDTVLYGVCEKCGK